LFVAACFVLNFTQLFFFLDKLNSDDRDKVVGNPKGGESPWGFGKILL